MKYLIDKQHGQWKIFSPLPLLSLLILIGALADSFGNPSPVALPSRETRGGEIERKTRIVIGNITIEEPRIVLRLGKGKKSERPFAEQLPSIGRAKISNGSLDIIMKDKGHELRLSAANIDIRDFSPERGGQAAFSTNFQYRLPGEKKTDVTGSGSGSLDFTAFTPQPVGNGRMKVSVDQGSYGPVAIDKVAADFSASVQRNQITLAPAEFAMGGLKVSTAKQPVSLKNIRLRGNAQYVLDSKRLTINSLKGSLPPIGEFEGNLSAIISKTIIAKASFDTPSIDLAGLRETVKAYVPAEYRQWTTQGKASVKTGIELHYAPDSLDVKGNQQIKVIGAGLSSPDGTKAFQGMQVIADLTGGYNSLQKKFYFSMSSQSSGGEVLWGTYYKDLSGNAAKAKASGTFTFKGAKPFSLDADTDLFGIGSLSVAGSGERGAQVFSIDAKNLSFQKAATFLPEDYLKQTFPSLAGFQISGNSSFKINIRRKAPQTEMNGNILVDNTSFTIPAKNVTVSGLKLNLPFELGYPKAAPSGQLPAGKSRQGLLEIKALEKDNVTTSKVHIPLLVWGNKVRMPEGANIHAAEGDIVISNFAADDILSAERKISFGLKIDHVNMAPIERSFTTSPITGTINAHYPKVEYSGERLNAEGNTKVSIFGGEIETGNISGERLFSSSRKMAFDVSFRDINLQQVTEKIAIGKMTGVIEGGIKNFEMEYGHPTRFVLDIDSKKKSGVSQNISVEAIQNISILGTGSGMMGVLNRGVMSFFKEYPYSKIGIQATLANDVFIVRGKIHEGNTEYLVRRGWLRGVDVVNQNPDNKISFKDMEERLKRIFESRKAGGAPVVQ